MAQTYGNYGSFPNTQNVRYGGFQQNTGIPHTGAGAYPPPGYGAVQNEPRNIPPPRKPETQTGSNPFSFLSSLKIDEEKAVIIFLLIILARNGADITLLAALGYLLM